MRSDIIKIDGIQYDVPVVDVKNQGSFLDKYAERTSDGNLHHEVIGFYSNYEIVFASGYLYQDSYRALWKKITEPEEFHMITLWDEDGEFTFEGYFAEPYRELKRIKNGVTYWKGMSVSVVSRKPTKA